MKMITLGDVTLHYRIDGDRDGYPVVFGNSLGTDFRLWDKILPLLPRGLRILRFDKRGHGLSSCPPGDYRMSQLVDDTAALMRALDFSDCLFVGLSIGGLIVQGLAANHPDLLRAMVISNSAARIGNAELWQDRISTLRSNGIEAIADNIMERWFVGRFRDQNALEIQAWRNMLTRTPANGYIGCSAAIADCDFSASSAGLSLPAMVIAGREDGSVPPEVAQATAELIPNARFELIEDSAHLPCVERPDEYVRILVDFMRQNGYS